MYPLGLTATANGTPTAEPTPTIKRAPAPITQPAPTSAPAPAPVPGPTPISDPSIVPVLTEDPVTTSAKYSRDLAEGVVEFTGPVHTEVARELFAELPPQPGTPRAGALVALGIVAVLTVVLAKRGRGV